MPEASTPAAAPAPAAAAPPSPTAPAAAPAAPGGPPAPPAPGSPAWLTEATRLLMGDEASPAAAPAGSPLGTPAPDPSAAAAAPPGPAAPRLGEDAAALARARADLDAQRAKWAQEQQTFRDTLRQQLTSEFQAMFDRDPVAFAKLVSKRDPKELARDFFIEGAGEALSPEHRAQAEQERQIKDAHRKLAELESRAAQAQQQQLLASYQAHLMAGFAELGDETPLVRAQAKKQPQVLAHQMLQIADRVARERPDLGVLGAAEIAKLLEPHLAEQLSPFEGYYESKYKPAALPAPAAAPPVPAAAPAAPAAPQTLGSQISNVTPPPAKLSENERMAAAVRALKGN